MFIHLSGSYRSPRRNPYKRFLFFAGTLAFADAIARANILILFCARTNYYAGTYTQKSDECQQRAYNNAPGAENLIAENIGII